MGLPGQNGPLLPSKSIQPPTIVSTIISGTKPSFISLSNEPNHPISTYVRFSVRKSHLPNGELYQIAKCLKVERLVTIIKSYADLCRSHFESGNCFLVGICLFSCSCIQCLDFVACCSEFSCYAL